MGLKTRQEWKDVAIADAQEANTYYDDLLVLPFDRVESLIDTMFVEHVLDGTVADSSEDYVILHTHESKPHPMSMKSNYTYAVVRLFSNKAVADSEIQHNQAYKWRGNGTGSVSWKAIKRSEVPKEAKWEI